MSCVTSDGSTDANWIVALGVPAVTLGAGQSNAHTPEERLDLAEFHSPCQVACTLADL